MRQRNKLLSIIYPVRRLIQIRTIFIKPSSVNQYHTCAISDPGPLQTLPVVCSVTWGPFLEAPGNYRARFQLFCFTFQMGVSKVLIIVQESYQLNKQHELY